MTDYVQVQSELTSEVSYLIEARRYINYNLVSWFVTSENRLFHLGTCGFRSRGETADPRDHCGS